MIRRRHATGGAVAVPRIVTYWRACCPCGWEGPERRFYHDTVADLAEHVEVGDE